MTPCPTRDEVVRTDLTPEQIATLDEEATVWASFTDVQADAIRATATRHFRDPLELALEMFPLLYEPATPLSAAGDSTVKEDLTPTTELPVLHPDTFTVVFTASGSPS